jgi:hypothetical protein
MVDPVVDYFPAGPERGEPANGNFLEIRVIFGIPEAVEIVWEKCVDGV